MTLHYDNQQDLYQANYVHDFIHEGIGVIDANPLSGVDMACTGSRHGEEGCMAFYKNPLPDRIAIEFDINLHKNHGLIIFYLALRGKHGEDAIKDAGRLPPRTGLMANYWSPIWGLQSYHLSVCRHNDKAIHTGTSNWRRNPGGILVGHGEDPIRQTNTDYHVRITKDSGSCQFFVNDQFAHGFVDHATHLGPPPDHGYFAIRLCGPDIQATVSHLTVWRIRPLALWSSRQEQAIDHEK
jgi:hypothetical protein